MARTYGAMAFTKLAPLGVPTPVTLSHPGAVVSEVSVPKVITNQRVENGLLYSALKYSVVLPSGAARSSAEMGDPLITPVTLLGELNGTTSVTAPEGRL